MPLRIASCTKLRARDDRVVKRHALRQARGNRRGQRASRAMRRWVGEARRGEFVNAVNVHQHVGDRVAFEMSAFDQHGARARCDAASAPHARIVRRIRSLSPASRAASGAFGVISVGQRETAGSSSPPRRLRRAARRRPWRPSPCRPRAAASYPPLREGRRHVRGEGIGDGLHARGRYQHPGLDRVGADVASTALIWSRDDFRRHGVEHHERPVVSCTVTAVIAVMA